ncbi:MAG: D-alanyl-D-alanine carboxypeptidase [Thermodesulfobacteriota bacterium]|nr:D-alanyl-D-alanine carboxypeptidase [Thermodesulfobacteriota bacterium]
MTAVLCQAVFAGPKEKIDAFIGPEDSIMVKACGAGGNVMIAKNTNVQRIPASILKVITVLAAFDILGKDHRFVTEFYRTPKNNLIIKGYGDPCLVSQEIERTTTLLAAQASGFRNILVDNQWFAPNIRVPGRTDHSLQPYDAPNGALCANYNTVRFAKKNGAYISAEPQTPLLPFAEKRLRHLPVTAGRVMFIDNATDGALYAGELFKYFLEKNDCPVTGNVIHGVVHQPADTLIYRHTSGESLADVAEKLLQYSNNFIANQLFLACGATVYGPPATMAKGIRAVTAFARKSLDISNLVIEEGSGLSRSNQISAQMMARALDAFAPYCDLMHGNSHEHYKTGTLDGISTRVGYIQDDNGMCYQYVVMINTPGKRADAIMPAVQQLIGFAGATAPE